MHEPPHQRQPKQGRKQKPRTSQSTSAERVSGTDGRKSIQPQRPSRPTSSAGNGILNQRQDTAICTRDTRTGLSETPGEFQASRMLRTEQLDEGSRSRRENATSTRSRQSHQTRQNFTRFAEVLDHFQAGDDRFSDLRHDDVPQVNPKPG